MSVNVGLQGYDTHARPPLLRRRAVTRPRDCRASHRRAWAFPVPFDTYGRSVSLYVEGASTRSKDGTISVNASDGFGRLRRRPRAAPRGGPRIHSRRFDWALRWSMVVSRQLATRLWPGKNPIGQRARRGGATGPEITVVGVVEDAKFETLGPSTSARVYMPLRQRYRDWQTLVVHTRGDPAAAIAQLKSTVAGADPALPVYRRHDDGAERRERALRRREPRRPSRHSSARSRC